MSMLIGPDIAPVLNGIPTINADANTYLKIGYFLNKIEKKA